MTMKIFPLHTTIISACIAATSWANPSPDKIRECVNGKITAHENRQAFQLEDRVECPQAYVHIEMKGLTPIVECRSHAREAVLAYDAPQGRRIIDNLDLSPVGGVPTNTGARIDKTFDNNGNLKAVRVVMRCESPRICPGGPGTHAHYRLRGTTANTYNQDNIMTWTIECAQNR